MIKAVFIDIDNTLLDFHLNAYYALKDAFKACDIPFKEEYFDTFITINDGLWRDIEEKVITRAQLKIIRFQLVFKAVGVIGDSVKAEEVFRSQLYFYAYPIDGAMDILQYLCSKYRVFAASNAIEKQQIARLKKVEMHDLFEKLFISEGIGHDKPSKEFFEYCFSSVGDITPSEAVMIGDSINADIKGGKDYGLTTVWFNRYGKKNPYPDYVDYEVRNLEDIKKIL